MPMYCVPHATTLFVHVHFYADTCLHTHAHTHTHTHTHGKLISANTAPPNAFCTGKGKTALKLFERRHAARPPNRDAAQPPATGSVSPSTRPPEVDEEGYSIRPPDASEIKFDDAEEKQWSSDSDDEGGSLSHMPIT